MSKKTTPLSSAFKSVHEAFEDLEEAFEEVLPIPAAPGDETDETDETETPRRRGSKKSSRKKSGRKKSITIEDVRAGLLKVIEEHGNKGATEVLGDFEVKKVSELDEEQYADVVKACEDYLDD